MSPHPSRICRYVGIDPGKSGGIAVLSFQEKGPTTRVSVHLQKMPEDRLGILLAIQETFKTHLNLLFAIEKVGGYVARPDKQDGTNTAPGSHMFGFGVNYGELCMAVSCCYLFCNSNPQSQPDPLINEIHPLTWQKHYKMKRDKGESKTSWKKRLLAVAQKLYPKEHITLQTSDALLLAHYLYEEFPCL